MPFSSTLLILDWSRFNASVSFLDLVTFLIPEGKNVNLPDLLNIPLGSVASGLSDVKRSCWGCRCGSTVPSGPCTVHHNWVWMAAGSPGGPRRTRSTGDRRCSWSVPIHSNGLKRQIGQVLVLLQVGNGIRMFCQTEVLCRESIWYFEESLGLKYGWHFKWNRCTNVLSYGSSPQVAAQQAALALSSLIHHQGLHVSSVLSPWCKSTQTTFRRRRVGSEGLSKYNLSSWAGETCSLFWYSGIDILKYQDVFTMICTAGLLYVAN